MEHEVVGRPDYAMARIRLGANESLWTESGAMVAHSGLEVETSSRGGIMAGLARKVLTGETFFQNKWIGPGRIDVAPGVPGDVLHIPLDGELVVQRGSYMACAEDVEISSDLGDLKSLLAEGDLFLLKATGRGDLFLASYGAIDTIDVDGTYAIDNGHLVAWESGLDMSIERVGSWKSTLLSGEGIVVRLRGQGRVWIQSRSIPPFVAWVNPFRRTKSSSDD